MPPLPDPDIFDLLSARYSDAPTPVSDTPTLRQMAARGSCRDFQDRAVPIDLIRMLCAVALAAPTKSDLQQRDIVILQSADQRQRIADLTPGQDWIAAAPMILVFCGNNRRQRLWHDWHDIAFANDHLDAMFNAAVDAGIALASFVTAAESMGLGCCPISALRNQAVAVSDLLGLPDHVFPVAGLALGYPVAPPQVSMRLPLDVTTHVDRYAETDLRGQIDTYDTARAAAQPYASQRLMDTFGHAEPYGWSLDKARQYSQPERADFGAFLRARGFDLR